MARKPTETVQVNLRMKEAFRRRLEREAEKHRISLNKEMTVRLENSFERDNQRTLDSTIADIARVGHVFHQLNRQGDLLCATEALVAAVEALPHEVREQPAIKAGVAAVRGVTNMIDAEAKAAARRARTL